MHKRQFLSKVLARTGLLGLISAMRGGLVRKLPILAYHRVVDADEATFPFDIELVSTSTAQFEAQMRYIRDHFTPITFRTLGDCLRGAAKLPRKPIVVTFDDGFDDNYTTAFPILKRLGVPATIFLSSGYIGGVQTFWFDRVAFMVLNTSASRVRIGKETEPLTDLQQRRGALKRILFRLKRMENGRRIKAIANIERQLGAGLPAQNSASKPLSWEQVAEMSAHGIEFGSHTVSHPTLTQLSPTALRQELLRSKQDIEAQLRQSVDVVSYPVGEQHAFDKSICEAAAETGYGFAVSYLQGNNRIDALDRYALRRIHIERQVDRDYFRAALCAPTIFP